MISRVEPQTEWATQITSSHSRSKWRLQGQRRRTPASQEAPPPMWTSPIPDKAAPWTARNKEFEEVKEENWRIKKEKEELMQEPKQNGVGKRKGKVAVINAEERKRSIEKYDSQGAEFEPPPPPPAGSFSNSTGNASWAAPSEHEMGASEKEEDEVTN